MQSFANELLLDLAEVTTHLKEQFIFQSFFNVGNNSKLNLVLKIKF